MAITSITCVWHPVHPLKMQMLKIYISKDKCFLTTLGNKAQKRGWFINKRIRMNLISTDYNHETILSEQSQQMNKLCKNIYQLILIIKPQNINILPKKILKNKSNLNTSPLPEAAGQWFCFMSSFK